MIKNTLLALTLIFPILIQSAIAKDAFPGRKIYPQVPHISTEALYQQRQQSIIIDARSKHEYETLRIKNAIHIPLSLSTSHFSNRLQQLRKGNNKPLIFYCNGHSCMKSYKAARRAMLFAKLDQVYAYDAGIFDWTREHPEEAELLGKSPVKAAQLISKAELKKHMLPALKFIRSATDKTEILDIRDRSQRDGFYIFSSFEHSIPLSNSRQLKKFILQVKRANKDLYVYDAVGKQVRWLQYYLQDMGIKRYFFMQGGARAYFDIPPGELID